MSDSKTRVLLISLAVVVLVGMGLIDSTSHKTSSTQAGGSTALLTSALPAGGAQSTGWYCSGGSGPSASAAETMYLTNTTRQQVQTLITAIPSAGARKSETLSLPAGAMKTVVPSQFDSASWVSATVIAFGGGVTASESVAGSPAGSSVPCASTTSSQWILPSASTAGGSDSYLSLLNPGDTSSELDVTVLEPGATPFDPPAFQGLVVPVDGLVTLDLAQHVQNAANFSVEVSAVSGSVVATELQESPGSSGTVNLLDLGLPGTSSLWSVPQSENSPSETSVLQIVNPNATDSLVTVHFALPGGSVDPIQIRVPDSTTVALKTTNLTRLAQSTPFSMLVSATGAPVAVFREEVGPSVDSVDPGISGGAVSWIVPIGESGGSQLSIVVQTATGGSVQASLAVDTVKEDFQLHGAKQSPITLSSPMFVSASPSKFPGSGSAAGSVLMISSRSSVSVSVEVPAPGGGAIEDIPIYPSAPVSP